MLLSVVAAIIGQAFGIAYSWLNQYLVAPFITFTRGFEFAIIFISAAIFLLISVFLLLRQAKKLLPNSYMVEITDLYGEKVSIDGVRQVFATHEAAESYARMYRESFGLQYRFRVVGFRQEKEISNKR
jgi:hypothetical protein